MGSSQIVRKRKVDVACVKTRFFKKVNFRVLHDLENGCTTEKSHEASCLAAVSGFCQKRFGKDFAGLPQSAPSRDEPHQIQVACFKPVLRKSVSPGELQKQHKRCDNILVSATEECFNAASKWCQKKKYSGGITQETTDTEIVVACYEAVYVGKVDISKGRKKKQQPTMKQKVSKKQPPGVKKPPQPKTKPPKRPQIKTSTETTKKVGKKPIIQPAPPAGKKKEKSIVDMLIGALNSLKGGTKTKQGKKTKPPAPKKEIEFEKETHKEQSVR